MSFVNLHPVTDNKAEARVVFARFAPLLEISKNPKREIIYVNNRKIERAARRNPGPSGPGQASYLSSCGKELAAPYRSGESPSFQEGVLQF